MFMVIIVIIAAGILIWFSFFGGNQIESSGAEPQLLDVTTEASTVGAVVKDKYIKSPDRRKGRQYVVHVIVFECDDGEEREFLVENQIFEEIAVGERDTLVYSDALFLGFGDHGSIGLDDCEDVDGGFSYDDFDENIDIEQIDDLPAENPLSGEDAEYLARFRARLKLPAKSETLEDETDSLLEYHAEDLVRKITLYPFLAREDGVRGMLAKTYREAVSDMLCYDGDSRKGMAADSVFINKNEIRLVIRLQELNPPLRSKITAEFGVNE